MSVPPRRTGPVNMGYLESTVGYSIRRAQIAVFQDIYAAFDDKAITLTQFSVLAVVADNPEITQSELAAALAVERPRIVPLLNALEQRKLALRVVCEDDKRNRRIVLTPEGRTLLKHLKDRFAKHEVRLRRLLGDDAAAMLRILRKLGKLPSPGRSAP